MAERIDLIARMKEDGNSEQTIAAGEAVLVTLRRTSNSRVSIWRWNRRTMAESPKQIAREKRQQYVSREEAEMARPQFTDANSNDVVFVNPLGVSKVRQWDRTGPTAIQFGKDNPLQVKEAPGEVAEKLWNALKEISGGA